MILMLRKLNIKIVTEYNKYIYIYSMYILTSWSSISHLELHSRHHAVMACHGCDWDHHQLHCQPLEPPKVVQTLSQLIPKGGNMDNPRSINGGFNGNI